MAVPAPALAQDGLREEIKAVPAKLTRAPKLLKFVEAVYPEPAKEALVEGTVELGLTIDQTGKVVAVEVMSAPDPLLGEAASQAAWRFEFAPAEVDGKPAPVRLAYAYNFVLDFKFEPRLPDWALDQEVVKLGDARLGGRVREQGSRLPLPGVAVAIRALGLEVKSDEKGYFRFQDLPDGHHEVEANSLEHKRESTKVEVSQGQQTQVTFYLEPLTDNAFETVVRGERRQTAVTRVTLRQKELTTVPGTFGDPVRVIENLPGMARLPLVGGALIIRGAAPSDSGIFLDGTEIPLIYHFLGGPSVLNPEFLDRIDYYPGNADARYGRLIAGVVDVHTRNTFTRQWGGSLDVNLINVAGMLKAPITERVSVAGAVRRSYIDALMPTLLSASGQEATTVMPVYYDYQLRVDVKLRGDDALFVLFFGSDDQLEIVSNEVDQDISLALDSQTTFHRVLAGWRWQVTDKLVSRLTPTLGFNYVQFGLGELKVDFSTFNFLLREDLEYKQSSLVTWRFGLDFQLEQLWADTKVPVPVFWRNPGSGQAVSFSDELIEFKVEPLLVETGLYLDGIFNVTDRLQIIPGARVDIFRYWGNTQAAVDPRLSARYTLFPKGEDWLHGTLLKGGAGHFSKAPEYRQAATQYGNPDVTPEHAVHLSLGVEQQIRPALNLDLQGFFIWRYNMVVPTSEKRGGVGSPLYYTNQGSGYSYGMELLLKHDVTDRLYGWIAYTLSRSMQQQKPHGDFVKYVFDQTHILTLVASVKVIWGIEVGTRFRLVSGRPDTPVLSGLFDNDQGLYTPITGEVRSERLPLFHQLDLRIEKTWLFELWKFSLYLDIQNLYNASNREATLYDYRYKESGPLPGIPILPTLGVKGSF